MLRKTLAATATAAALLAGGVLTAAPAIAANDLTVFLQAPDRWSYSPPQEKPTYILYGGEAGTPPTEECGGLYDPVYVEPAQICFFTVPTPVDADTFGSLRMPSWKAISPTGGVYEVATYIGRVNNPPFPFGVKMYLENDTTSASGKLSVDPKLVKDDGYRLFISPAQESVERVLESEWDAAMQASASTVGAAVNVNVESTEPRVPAITTRSKSLASSNYQIMKSQQARVERMAAKVHNRGGVLTIHAYGPDENLALARARAVRAHLEAQLAKRGHTESSPIWVTYAGDPGHKKNTHVTVHWHPNTNVPGALPGTK